VRSGLNKEGVMPDDTSTDDGKDEGATPEPDPNAGAKKALDAERKARRDAERQLKELSERLQEIEDRDKSEADKTAERLAAAEARATEAEAGLMRAHVAAAKGLTPDQAKRLVGTTQEELEADADVLLETFQVPGATPPPERTPRPDLRGGGDPTAPEDVDIRKVVDAIPRGI
jgi:hypothetical protein